MLKYGCNEKMTFCVRHERQKLFWDIIIFIRRVPPSNYVVVTFKGLFLTSTTQTLLTFNGGNCSFDVFFFYIRLQASSLISMRNRFVYDGWV